MSKPEQERKKPTPTRIAIWIGVGGVGLYMLVAGLIQVLNGG